MSHIDLERKTSEVKAGWYTITHASHYRLFFSYEKWPMIVADLLWDIQTLTLRMTGTRCEDMELTKDEYIQ